MSQGSGLNLVRAYLEQAQERLRDVDIDDLDDVRIEWCAEISKERKKKIPSTRRYYAHVDHEKDVICFADDVGKLDPRKQAGLVLHELGHLLDDVLEETEPSQHELNKAQDVYEAGRVEEEATANQAIDDTLRVEITYGKDRVQRISEEDLAWLESTA
jgi:hypothetical protein